MRADVFITLAKYFIATLIEIIIVGLLLFAINGVFLANGEKVIAGTTKHPPKIYDCGTSIEIKVMAYNIAKGFIQKGGWGRG